MNRNPFLKTHAKSQHGPRNLRFPIKGIITIIPNIIPIPLVAYFCNCKLNKTRAFHRFQPYRKDKINFIIYPS